MGGRSSPPALRVLSLPFILAVAACDHAPTKGEAHKELRWTDSRAAPPDGPQFDDEDFALSVEAPRRCDEKGPMAPKAGTARLSVPVEIRAKTQRQIPVSALLFTLEDTKGHEFRPTLAGCSPTLPQRNLIRDEKISGEVAFDVPQGFKPAELRFEPFLIGRKKITARVKIPQ